MKKVYCVLINQVVESEELRNDVRIFASKKSATDYAIAFIEDETKEVLNDGWVIDDNFEKHGTWESYMNGDYVCNHSCLTLSEEEVIED